MSTKTNKNVKRKNKKKNNNFVTFFLPFLIVLSVALMLVITELTIVSRNRKKINKPEENKNAVINVPKDEIAPKEEKNGIMFNSFVDSSYTQEELENLSVAELIELRQNQIIKNNGTANLLTDKIAGSTPNSDGAKVKASNLYDDKNQFIRKLKIAADTDVYFLVDVEWDYVSESATRKYNQQVLVFKEFYYNVEKGILNLDDVDMVKQCLDIENYIEYYSNTSKRLIQSFMIKEGERCEYVLYYFDIKYGGDTGHDTMCLCKETIKINAATGKLEDKNTEEISTRIEI